MKQVNKSGLLAAGETVEAATGSLPWSQIAGAEADSGALKKKMALRFVDGTSVNLEAGKVIKIEPLSEAINRRATRS